MSVKETAIANRPRWVNRAGSVLPFYAGKVHDELERLIKERESVKRCVALFDSVGWAFIREEINGRIEDWTQLTCRFSVDPAKYHNQLIDASARRDELQKFIGGIEGSPDRLEKLTKQINELYEITRTNPT